MSGTEIEVPTGMHIEQTGPEAAPAAAETEPKRSPREEMMLRIAENAEKQRHQELAYAETQAREARSRAAEVDETTAAELAAEEEERATEAARQALEQQQPIQEAPQVSPAAPAQPKLRTIDWQGQQFQVTDAQYEQLARDGILARQVVARAPQQQQIQPPAPASEPPKPQPLLTEEEARQFAKKMQYGDEAETAQTIRELAETIAQRQPRAPQIDPQQVISAAVQQAEQQRVLNRNLEIIGTEYPDIFSNNTLTQLAVLKLGEVRARNQALNVAQPDLDAYREACSMVRTALGGQPQPQPGAQVPTAPQAASQPSRLDRKRAAPSVPQAADRRPGAAVTQRYPSYSEVVDSYRKARGQSPMR